MTEIMKEIPENVNPIITRSTGNSVIQYPKKDTVHQYTKRDNRKVFSLLASRSEEECAAIIAKVDKINYLPNIMLATTGEVARFFQIDYDTFNSRRCGMINYGHKLGIDFRSVVPFYCTTTIKNTIQDHAPNTKFFTEKPNVFCEVAPGIAMRIGTIYNSRVSMFTPKGIIVIAYYLCNGFSEDNRRVAKLLVDECEKSGLFDPPKPKPEPVEIPVIGESKLDYPETITKAFIAMMTLLVKVSEEHGAEKVIQRLKEEGKL